MFHHLFCRLGVEGDPFGNCLHETVFVQVDPFWSEPISPSRVSREGHVNGALSRLGKTAHLKTGQGSRGFDVFSARGSREPEREHFTCDFVGGRLRTASPS